jgi:glycosyltransferase involved in cell wall biosynthesis
MLYERRKMNKSPIISVILPVYNAEKFAHEAINSILKQTITDFELLIINDGSTDRSNEIIEGFKDSRIKVIQNQKNLGLIGTLNKGFNLAKGQFIARMDADDISIPNRFEKQLAYLTNHPEIDILGTQIKVFGTENYISKFNTDQEEIEIQLYFESMINHPTVMIRREFLVKHKLKFDTQFPHCEDWGLWLNSLSYHAKFKNLPDILLNYRVEGQNISIKNKDTELERHYNLYAAFLPNLLENVTPAVVQTHMACSKGIVKKLTPKEINNHFRLLQKAFIFNGYKPLTVKKILAQKKNKLFYKFADKNLGQAFIFMLINNYTFKFNYYRYLFSKLR